MELEVGRPLEHRVGIIREGSWLQAAGGPAKAGEAVLADGRDWQLLLRLALRQQAYPHHGWEERDCCGRVFEPGNGH